MQPGPVRATVAAGAGPRPGGRDSGLKDYPHKQLTH